MRCLLATTVAVGMRRHFSAYRQNLLSKMLDLPPDRKRVSFIGSDVVHMLSLGEARRVNCLARVWVGSIVREADEVRAVPNVGLVGHHRLGAAREDSHLLSLDRFLFSVIQGGLEANRL